MGGYTFNVAELAIQLMKQKSMKGEHYTQPSSLGRLPGVELGP